METRRIRLGDVIDDYCSRCRLLMNHGVVSIVGDDVKKVRCNTCLSEHAYRRGKLPAAKRNATSKLFDEVLRSVAKPERTVPAAPAARMGETASDEAGREEPGSAASTNDGAGPAGDGDAPVDTGESAAPPEGGDDAPASPPDPDRPRPGPETAPVRMQRKLYTIRRAISDKSVDKGPKKS